MIKKLQRKFVLITMGSLLLVMVVVLGAVNAVNIHQMKEKADNLLQVLSENGGKFPSPGNQNKEDARPETSGRPGFQMNAETRFETRYFLAKASESGEVVQIDTSHIAAVSSAAAREYAQQALASGKAGGFIGEYRYLVTEQSDGNLVVFVDCRNQMETTKNFLIASFGIGLVSFAVVALLVSVLSRRAIRPVVESMEKQKRFITDAGHEIKTPLAIISANTDVLELQDGKSEWTASIRGQVARLSGLVESMLTLTRMEEDGVRLQFSEVLLSELTGKETELFRTLAATRGCVLTEQIAPGVTVRGEENSLRQLISILLDNAVKYAKEGGAIRVRLEQNGKGARLSVYNDLEKPPEGNLTRMFDRFYREDSSRTRETGGYGIGLSIAAAVAQTHHAELSVQARGSGIEFTAVLKN